MLRQQLLDSDHQDGEGGLEVGEKGKDQEMVKTCWLKMFENYFWNKQTVHVTSCTH